MAIARFTARISYSCLAETVKRYEQKSLLDTVSTTRGSGWVRSGATVPITLVLGHRCHPLRCRYPSCLRAAHPPAIAGGTDRFQVGLNAFKTKRREREIRACSAALFSAGRGENFTKRPFETSPRYCLPVSCLYKTRIPLPHSLKYFPVLKSAANGRLADCPLTLSIWFRTTERDKRMATRSSDGITQLLERWSNGEEKARDELMALVYDELHRLAANYLHRERREHTLQPTALVNELFLKFSEQHSMSWQNRAQFFGVAAQLMRRILVDSARAHRAEKRGGDRLCVSLKNIAAFGAQPDADLLALHDALNGLAEIDPVPARIVELRFFGGLTIKETAEVMGISHATVEREWKTAKAYLKRELTRTKKPS